MSVAPHCADWTPSSRACGVQIALACSSPHLGHPFSFDYLAWPTKSPLNLNLYETMTPTRPDLCRNTLLIIISRLSFYFNLLARPLLCCRQSALSCLRKAKIVGSGHTHTHTHQTIFMYGYCRCRVLLLSLMHSYSIGSTPRSGHNVRSITCCSFDYVAATRRDGRRTCSPFSSFFYSVSYTLVRYFYRSCGGPLALLAAQQQSGRLFVYLFVLQYVSFPLPFPGATIQPSFHPYSFNDVIIFSHLFLGCFLPNFLAALLLLLVVVVVVVFLLFIRQTSSEQQEQQQLNWLAVRLLSRIPPWNMLVCINSS